jgi:hypothetical protein
VEEALARLGDEWRRATAATTKDDGALFNLDAKSFEPPLHDLTVNGVPLDVQHAHSLQGG